MPASIFKFLASEDGAVTVDWVVLTAAIVGIGTVTVFSVAGGTTTAANTISSSLASQGVIIEF